MHLSLFRHAWSYAFPRRSLTLLVGRLVGGQFPVKCIGPFDRLRAGSLLRSGLQELHRLLTSRQGGETSAGTQRDPTCAVVVDELADKSVRPT